MSDPVRLRTLLGDYPVTQALKAGKVASPGVAFDYADIKPPSSGFKRVVRNLEFDVAEMAIVTYLMAKAHGKPYVLLPAVIVGRFQHPFIVYNIERGPLAPADLAGRRVGIRSYSVTTGAWVRGILSNDYGVDIDRVTWVTFEEAHVAEFKDPPNVQRAPEGKEIMAMLLEGEIDAAILGAIPTDPRLRPLIADPEAAAREWQKKYGASLQVNHLVVVRDSISKSNPAAVKEIFRLLSESKKAAGLPKPGAADANPFGVESMRRSLEVVIDYSHQQRLIPRRYAVEELFDGTTLKLT